MSTPAGGAAYAEGYLAEDDALGEARALGTSAGAHPISPAGGAALSVLAATVAARAVVEIGTGAGVSGLYLLRGMAADGVLTTIDVDPELQRAAKRTAIGAGYGPGRLRLINGMALDVLPRLTDGGYDLVVADAVPAEYPGYLAEAVRLLRPGGVLVLEGVLDRGRVAGDGSEDGPGTAALRETAALVRDDERLLSALLPVADGMLCAVRR
ncbi:O-methyltransferase, family 3 [Pseudonocardia sp. Ae168_Ps1]|uniref:O-methyltransferase n=1 Tax=unclassified Pseudonocardia TaxID=2619320 RepID=UPI00094ADAA1|nr:MULTISPECIES: class I SAM-dependent methyltransferase [unclassified Pseudonocardia]OLL75778.1 O-methyltransferase, family 3 [Pseudonocardia sp. Ae150A_Ps1]OLL81778.1 O-methyltransferase, family 3 [Pseudonocardia sp. Ae168_Ps1]OLL84112.1 O-methyltransferase, family 3 [Pseudonocardia sp. Ae263_Ps1]OLL95870.1 O-methyltransferase, family 3 [Pseudonocardia sp. Ae356_Ps1]